MFFIKVVGSIEKANEFFKEYKTKIKNIINIIESNNNYLLLCNMEDTTKSTKVSKATVLEFVRLTDEELLKLCKGYGQTVVEHYIERLNNYIGQKKKDPYRSHYHTLLNWMAKDNVPKLKQEVETKEEMTRDEVIKFLKRKNPMVVANKYKELLDKYKLTVQDIVA